MNQNMKEKYESLSLATLRDLAKARNLKGTSAMKKADLVQLMLDEDERAEKAEQEKRQPRAEKPRTEAGKGEAGAASHPRRKIVRVDNRNKEEQPVRGERSHRPERTESPVEQTTPAAPATEPAKTVTVEENAEFPAELDSGQQAEGILEVMPDGYGFIRCENYLPGEKDVYVAPSQIRRFGLKTGDILVGNTRIKTQAEKFSALLYVKTINGYTPEEAAKRTNFEDMTPIFPNERLKLETPGASVAMRVMDLMSPVGKGQRGMIVSPPKAGKTTLLKEVAQSVKRNSPDVHLIILLIDERPEEVTDIKEAIEGPNV